MTKEKLIQTASLLKQPGQSTFEEFYSKSESMAILINERFKARPDLLQMVGEGNIEMMMDNHRNHIRFMSSLFSDYQPEILVDTVLWVFRAYRSHGFRLAYWPAQLDTWVQVFRENLSATCYDEVYPYYYWMIVNNPSFAILSDQILQNDQDRQIGLHQ